MAKKKILSKDIIDGSEGWEFCKGVYVVRTIEGPGEWYLNIDNQQFPDVYMSKEEAIVIKDALIEAVEFMGK
jgi:hypothetical protein